MTYVETIEGPWGPTEGSPFGTRLVWQISTARLFGERIDATLAGTGLDWIRLGPDGLRRQDLRATLRTDDGEIVLFSYDNALIRADDRFARRSVPARQPSSTTSTCAWSLGSTPAQPGTPG